MVISIIAVLIDLLLPALEKTRDIARQSVCLSHQRQFGIVLLSFAGDNDDFFPDVRSGDGDVFGNTWYTNMMPWLDSSKSPIVGRLYDRPLEEQRAHNTAWERMICPAEDTDSETVYDRQGVHMTYGINMAGETAPDPYSYWHGYGVAVWQVGKKRRFTDIAYPSTGHALTDTRGGMQGCRPMIGVGQQFPVG